MTTKSWLVVVVVVVIAVTKAKAEQYLNDDCDGDEVGDDDGCNDAVSYNDDDRDDGYGYIGMI